jgi:hypothetical protein
MLAITSPVRGSLVSNVLPEEEISKVTPKKIKWEKPLEFLSWTLLDRNSLTDVL